MSLESPTTVQEDYAAYERREIEQHDILSVHPAERKGFYAGYAAALCELDRVYAGGELGEDEFWDDRDEALQAAHRLMEMMKRRVSEIESAYGRYEMPKERV